MADLASQARDENKEALSTSLSKYTFAVANTEIKSAVLLSGGETAAKQIQIDSTPASFYRNVDEYKKLVDGRAVRGFNEMRATTDLSKLGRANSSDLGLANIPALPMFKQPN